MATNLSGLSDDLARALKELAELRNYSGPPREFWPRYLACLGELTAARKVSLLFKDASKPPLWKTIHEWSAHTGPAGFLVAFTMQLSEVAEHCVTDGKQIFPQESVRSHGEGPFVLAGRLKLHRSEEAYVVTCLVPEINQATARELVLRLNLAADVPESYHLSLISRQAKGDVEKFAVVLDVMAAVNAEKRFLAAALAFCNGLASRFNCERVSLGWLEGGYIRLRTISRTEKFDRQMAAAKALEVAMEECLDQDEEVAWPAPEGATFVARDHQAFATEQQAGNLCSLPLRADNKAAAVLTCERQNGPFTPVELQQLRLCCDQAAPRLADLKHHDRWFGARWAAAAKEQCAKIIGPEHTWAKVLAVVIVTLLAVLFFVRVHFRVEGNFNLRSDEVAYLTTPFDGYIHNVFVRPGDTVTNGSPLLSLDTSELELEESAALADLNRYLREAEKARAAKALAEMRISQALADQSKARLDLVRYRLDRAVIKSPFAGVVAEGDLRERLGAPVKQGEPLFKIARTDTLYVEAEINERDVHEILGRATGEIAFVSQPKLKYPIRIVAIEPAAVSKTAGNVFLVRCAFDGGPQPWWRPGMSGVCKLSVEKRTLFWILTHRTVDFLRLWLWW